MDQDDINETLVQIGTALTLLTQCEQQTEKQIKGLRLEVADLRLEIAAIKFGQDAEPK